MTRPPRLATKWKICLLLFLATTLNYLDRQTLSVLAPTLQKDLHLDNEALGWLFAVFYYTYTLSHFAVGPILDRTHLHFYTKDTAIDMLAAAGLKVERASVTGVPIDELWKRGEGNFLFRALVRTQHLFLSLLPRMFGYQWIFVASAAP